MHGKISIVGCGLIGQGWATVFARAGFQVSLYDAGEGRAQDALDGMKVRLADLHKYDLLQGKSVDEVLQNFEVAETLEQSVEGAIYIQENGPEILEVKETLTRQIDALAAPNTPIGSSTSGLSASLYCENIKGRDRCLVVHPVNPPHLIPAVEVVPTPWTNSRCVDAVVTLMEKVGQQPIKMDKEIDGFVVNRLQGALLQEAFRLVDGGFVTASDLDKAISYGLGLRWSFMGPFETIHLNAPGGIADYAQRYGDMYHGFAATQIETSNWDDVIADGVAEEMTQKTSLSDIADAQTFRDSRLMALLKHQKSLKEEV